MFLGVFAHKTKLLKHFSRAHCGPRASALKSWSLYLRVPCFSPLYQETINTGPFVMRSTCRRCGGRGSIITSPCVVCRGAGQAKQKKKVVIPVPAGGRWSSSMPWAPGGLRLGSPWDLAIVKATVKALEVGSRGGLESLHFLSVLVIPKICPFPVTLGGGI